MVEGLESRRLLASGISEFPIPTANSSPFWITSGPGEALYFTASGTDQIGLFNPSTHSFSTFSIPTSGFAPSYITTNPDGSLYFTGTNVDAIEQFNPTTFAFTTIPIAITGLGAQYITTGPDGNLYFTTANANVIEQLNPTTRVFRSFFIPTSNSGATGITSGPDNSLWFVESSANKIAELNLTTNVITEFPIPNTIGGASTITMGADGNLYFTEPGANAIGQFNPTSHNFRPVPIPAADSGVAGITAGPDGNLYFTQPGANAVGQLNPATLGITQLAIPTTGSGANAITAGPDGNVYFTETNANKIGQVLITIPPTTTTTTTATQLTVSPNPAIVGQVITLTATVRTTSGAKPTGTVTFLIDGTPQPPVKLKVHHGVGTANLSTKLADADHLITARFNGKSTTAGSVSNTVSLVVFPAPGDGPTVVHLDRLGYHDAPTTLILIFDRALAPETAQDPRNYKITDSEGHTIPIRSILYDPSTLTVTISPSRRLNFHRTYVLTVKGKPPTGLTDPAGIFLDGALTGHPGSNYVTKVTALDLIIPTID